MEIGDNLISHLKSFGYNIEYSVNDDLCSKALIKHLGRKRYNEYGNYVFTMQKMFGVMELEKAIEDYIGNDEVFYKILLSGQILISVQILNEIIKSIKETSQSTELNLLELGGGDGWASHYLINEFPNFNINVVDFKSRGNSKDARVKLIHSSYADFESDLRFDIVFSILGINYSNIDELMDCVDRNSQKNTIVYLGLRVQPEDYKTVEKNMERLGFELIENQTQLIKVELGTGLQTFPMFKFRKK